MLNADASYLLGAVMFFAVPFVFILERAKHGFHSEEAMIDYGRDWLVILTLMYCFIGLLTFLVSASAVPGKETGLSNTEKLEYVGLGSGAFEFQPDTRKMQRGFTGFFGYTDMFQKSDTVGILYVDGDVWNGSEQFFDRTKTRIVASDRNFRVVLHFKSDATRNPIPFADGTAALPHYASGCRLTFKAIWPTCHYAAYTEKIISGSPGALSLQPIIDKDLESATLYVPANYAKAFQPTSH
jgi:hypothetical protein